MRVPIDFSVNGGVARFTYADSSDIDLSRAFFYRSIFHLREKPLPYKKFCITDLHSRKNQPVKIAGMIFHTGRCGSTWLSEMLKLDISAMVISEPAVFNRIVVCRYLSFSQKIRLLNYVFSMYRRWADSLNKKLVIKLTSYNTFFLQIYTKSVDAEIVFVYSNAYKYVGSFVRSPLGWSRTPKVIHMLRHLVKFSESDLLDKEISSAVGYIDDGQTTSSVTLLANVYRAYSDQIIKLASTYDIAMVDYTQLDTCIDKVSEKFGLNVDNHAIEKLSELDVKTGKVFVRSKSEKIDEKIKHWLVHNLPLHSRVFEDAYRSLVVHQNNLMCVQ